MKPNALVVRTAGTNCDRETEYALQQAGFSAERIHVFRLMEAPQTLREFQFLVIPGGFSYGDDIAAGKILANQMLHRLAEPLNDFVAAGKLVLGICNGFQVLLKSGLLPWAEVAPDKAARDATLTWNDSGMFVDRWVGLRCDSDACVYLPKGEQLVLPIAHGEGKFVTRTPEILDTLKKNDQIALRYVAPPAAPDGYLANPNGSVEDIAGICDPSGRVMALMPHPERFLHPTHHPQWTRTEIRRADGRLFFDNAFAYLNG
jgi:phosphoribosylformylglycinamidine synthase